MRAAGRRRPIPGGVLVTRRGSGQRHQEQAADHQGTARDPSQAGRGCSKATSDVVERDGRDDGRRRHDEPREDGGPQALGEEHGGQDGEAAEDASDPRPPRRLRKCAPVAACSAAGPGSSPQRRRDGPPSRRGRQEGLAEGLVEGRVGTAAASGPLRVPRPRSRGGTAMPVRHAPCIGRPGPRCGPVLVVCGARGSPHRAMFAFNTDGDPGPRPTHRIVKDDEASFRDPWRSGNPGRTL